MGVSLVPKKTCTFDCIYCQAGRCSQTKIKRAGYINFSRFKKELKEITAKKLKIDFITFSGSGEPTLHKDLDKIISIVKKVTKNKYPVCLITNSSLLYRRQVRQELQKADVLIPSLDASGSDSLQKINQPYPGITLKKIISGLIDLRKEFKGEIWLEIMILGQINDSIKEAYKIKRIVDKIKPDKIQINLPVRPCAEKFHLPQAGRLNKIKSIIGSDVEVFSNQSFK